MKALILDKKITYNNHTFTAPIIIKSNEVELINCSSVGIHGNKLIAVEIACDNYTLNNFKLKNVDIGIIVDGKNCRVSNCLIDGYTEDAIRFCKDFAEITGNVIINYNGENTAHHDAIQFYSGNQDYHYSWMGRYVLGPVLSGCKIIGNVIIDESPVVQGIFCSDGLLGDFLISENIVSLPYANHSISVSGLQRGHSEVSYNKIVGPKMKIQKARRDIGNIGGDLKVVIIEGSKPQPVPVVPVAPAKKKDEYKYVWKCKRTWRTLWFKKCERIKVKI